MIQRWAAALAGGLALAALQNAAPGAVLGWAALFTLGLGFLQWLACRAVPAHSRSLVALWAAAPVALPFVYLLARLRHVDAWTPVGIVGALCVVGLLATVLAARARAPWAEAEAWPEARLRTAQAMPLETLPAWLGLILLGLTLAVALWLRWPLLSEGLPYAWVWDEIWTTHEAVRMGQAGEWVPHVNYYPALAVYLQLFWVKLWGPWLTAGLAIASGAGSEADPWLLRPSNLLFMGRLLNTLLALGAITLIYRAGSRAYGRAGALCAAAWLALDPFFLRYSTWTVVDFTTAAFTVLWLLALGRYLHAPSRWTARLLAVAAGLVIASKYNAAVVLLVSLAVTQPWQQGWRAQARAAGTCIAWALAAYCVASPTFILSLREVASGLQYNLDMYSNGGHPGFERIDSPLLKAWHDVRALADASSLRPLLFAMPLLAFVIWREKAKAAGVALAAAALYLLLMAKTIVCNDANLLMLVPLLIFSAGQGFAWLGQRFGTWAAVGLAVILLWSPAQKALQARSSAVTYGADARHLVALRAAQMPHDVQVAVLIESRLHPEDLELLGSRVVPFSVENLNVLRLRQKDVARVLLSDLKAHPGLLERFKPYRIVAAEGKGRPIANGSPACDPPTWLVELLPVH